MNDYPLGRKQDGTTVVLVPTADWLHVADDVAALTAIQAALDGREWSADTLDVIADLVRSTGRSIEDCNTVESVLAEHGIEL